MSDWYRRLTEELEPILAEPDPRSALSVYHDMPAAIFVYEPSVEFALRGELALLETRLTQRGKHVTRISLAEILGEALSAESPGDLVAAERIVGVEKTIDTLHQLLNPSKKEDPSAIDMVDRVVERMPRSPDPGKDVVFILRAGALFPAYRTSSLVDQLKGRISVPTVLFYPGLLDGAAGLRFMGVLEPEHNYRARIF